MLFENGPLSREHSPMSTPAELKGKQRQPPVVQPGSGNSIIINPSQRLNPVIECIRNVSKEFGDILPDYQVGKTTGVLFLRQVQPSLFSHLARLYLTFFWDFARSLRYHRLHPEYIHQRIERLGQSYNLRILLLMCDIVRPLFLPQPRHHQLNPLHFASQNIKSPFESSQRSA